MSYKAEYQRSMNDPEGFWRKQAEDLDWFKFPQQILTRDANGVGYWFADGEMNTAYMALDHHVKNGRGDQLALILRLSRHQHQGEVHLRRTDRCGGAYRRACWPIWAWSKATASSSTCR